MCQQLRIPFLSNYEGETFFLKPPISSSEKDLRDFRYFCFSKWREEQKNPILVLAHHAGDLLETRLLRLIRGVGSESFESMKVFKGFCLRPFLLKDIKDYVEKKKIPYEEDPSNQDVKYFRNWIRHKWLPELELYQKGSVYRLSQSFEILSKSVSENLQKQSKNFDPFFFSFQHEEQKRGEKKKSVKKTSLKTEVFRKLPHGEKRKVLIAYMKGLELKNYSSGHVEEILKRLETNSAHQKTFGFSMLGKVWVLGTKTIEARDKEKPS